MPVIFACPGTGKSFFCKKSKLWKDQDLLMHTLHDGSWHNQTHSQTQEKNHYLRIDKELKQLTKSNYIIGSLFWNYVPDAIVVIDDKTLRRHIQQRQRGNEPISYKRAKQVETVLKSMAKIHNVPIFNSFEGATRYVLINVPLK